MEFIGEILQPHLEPSSHKPNRSIPFAARRDNLMAADKFDASIHGAPAVSLLFRGLNHGWKADVIWRNSINERSCMAYEWIGQEFC